MPKRLSGPTMKARSSAERHGGIPVSGRVEGGSRRESLTIGCGFRSFVRLYDGHDEEDTWNL